VAILITIKVSLDDHIDQDGHEVLAGYKEKDKVAMTIPRSRMTTTIKMTMKSCGS
jgi:hypothetical protein